MEIALATKQQLSTLLAKPALVTQAHAELLAQLVKTYPYYQPLHLLLARATINTEHPSILASAALYNGGGLLHKVVYQPENLSIRPVKLVVLKDETEVEQELTEVAPNAEPDEQETYEEIAEFKIGDEVEAKAEEEPIAVAPQTTRIAESDEQETYEEIAEFKMGNEVEAKAEEELIAVAPPPTTSVEETDEQETYEEISEAAVKLTPSKNNEEDAVFDEISETGNLSIPQPFETPIAPATTIPIESIVGIDFFAFEKSNVERTNKESAFVAPEEYNLVAEAQTVSKYNDDKLPYTFLWWLAKTRKEHEQIFQPYVSQKKSTEPPTSPLQQQYVEHIFHLQTPFNLTETAAKGPLKPTLQKGSEMIEKFIKNDPQIRPLKAEQLNNENKAKKSAEDTYDLVSETLAAIYIEQTLYHKAIDTYEKLSLKFPEKSRYFADLIQSLEKKI
jgi:hypothetical protein